MTNYFLAVFLILAIDFIVIAIKIKYAVKAQGNGLNPHPLTDQNLRIPAVVISEQATVITRRQKNTQTAMG